MINMQRSSTNEFLCTICRLPTYSISELHQHQTYFHTAGELSLSIIRLIHDESFRGEMAKEESIYSIPLQTTWQNSGNNEGMNFVSEHGENAIYPIEDLAQLMQCESDPRQNCIFENSRPLAEPPRGNPSEGSPSSLVPSSNGKLTLQCNTSTDLTEADLYNVEKISDELFLKSIDGICNDLKKYRKCAMMKTRSVLPQIKSSAIVGKKKSQSSGPKKFGTTNSMAIFPKPPDVVSQSLEIDTSSVKEKLNMETTPEHLPRLQPLQYCMQTEQKVGNNVETDLTLPPELERFDKDLSDERDTVSFDQEETIKDDEKPYEDMPLLEIATPVSNIDINGKTLPSKDASVNSSELGQVITVTFWGL
ncbi:uncharacterized protein LOC105691839 [Athalia rosae]|uniref:uncharacterized protein LOC105691839 n=1 Tax=Athalia rosae TaxID=37344 RepID=UPI0020334053|nr:uncharacterized protein LOC105691839 [Athalia rosae]